MAGHPALEHTLDHVAASHYSSSAPEGQVFLLGLGDTCGLLLELLSLDLGLECVDRVGSQQHGAGPRWLPQVPWAGPGVSQATMSEAPSPGKRTTELVPWRQSHILPTALCCPWSVGPPGSFVSSFPQLSAAVDGATRTTVSSECKSLLAAST